jgi:serine/threonine protein kinase
MVTTPIELENTEALLKRKVFLDSSLMSLSIAGMEIPSEWVAEFEAVQIELTRRNVSFPALSDEGAWSNWLGKTIDGYKILYLIEDGLYSLMFGAESEDVSANQDGAIVIKLAKQPSYYRIETGNIPRPTRIFAIDGDIVREVRPSQNALIAAEVQRMGALAGENLPELPILTGFGTTVLKDNGFPQLLNADGTPMVNPTSPNSKTKFQYYFTPQVEGDRLADLLQYGTGRHQSFEIVSMFSQIASTLADMMSNEGFIYHGNLKPENILFTAGGVYFRELGDFCSLACNDVLEPEVRITTPQYYPWLDVDDIGALGACLWEALTDYHPFDDTRAAEGECILGADMRALIDFELSLANMFVLPLLNLKRPHQFGINTTEKLENLLFKSIKMRVGEDGLIHEDAGYASMAEFSDALLDLLNEPTMIF